MNETNGIVWHVSYKPDMGRYPFPLPKSVADSIERSSCPVWHRYSDYALGGGVADVLDAVDGWGNMFEAMLLILRDLSADDLDMKLWGLRGAFQVLYHDLTDLLHFGERTLPYDPSVVKAVRQAIDEYPELFSGDRKTTTGDSEADAALSSDLPEEEECVDAALPVPPQDAAAMQ